MKRMLPVTTLMLSTTTLAAVIVAGCSSGAVTQQAFRDDLQNQEPAAAIYRDREEKPEPPSARSQRLQPSRDDALQSESRGSGLAPVPYVATVAVGIEQVPGAERERYD